MRFYTQRECEEWLVGRQRQKPEKAHGIASLRIGYPPEPHRMFYYARWIAESLTFKQPALLWITEWGIWSSSENWHLYSKLREAYGDTRLLEESPGHYFLDHETADLATFLQTAMLNGWGGYVLTAADYANVFFSHDEYIDFFAKRRENLPDIREGLGVEPVEDKASD
jgi:hypothetical protein